MAKSITLIGLVFTLSCTSVFAGAARPSDPIPQVVSGGVSYALTSAASGETFRVDLRIPPVPPPPAGFPVFYVLDGNLQFPIAAAIAPLRAYESGLPQAVIVGIGYPENDGAAIRRRRSGDLTITPSLQSLPQPLQALKPNVGGADRFLRFLAEEAMPFVARHAPVNQKCQTLYGHSLGGLFVLHALFTRPGLFQSYVAASPSIWWDDKAVLKEEAPYLERVGRGGTPARLLITAGQLEPLSADAKALADDLASRKLAALEVSSRLFPDEKHVSVIPASINVALEFGLQCPGQA